MRCIYHCSECSSHFASLGAFDTHRDGDHQAGTRHCLEPLDDARFAAKTEDGACNVGANYVDPKHGVTVWQLAVTEAERARVSQLPVKASKATKHPLAAQCTPEAA
jgi:hypothetical protein